MKRFITTAAAGLLSASGAMAQDAAGSFGPELDVSGFAGVSFSYFDYEGGSNRFGIAGTGTGNFGQP